MWQWIMNNSGWLIPLIIFVGNEIVKRTKTETDNDIWKFISYFLERVFGNKNKDKNGEQIPVYSREDLKPKAAKLLDQIADEVEKRLRKKIKEDQNKF